MSETAHTRHNLVFAGQLLPGTDRDRAERTLAAFFGLRDPAAVRGFFSGRPVPLRRDLSRDEALRLYRQLRGVGLICEVSRADRAIAGPVDKPRPASHATAPGAHCAAPGSAPNFFTLRPARAGTGDEPGEQARIRALVLGAIAAALCLIVVVINLRFAAPAPGAEPHGPLAVASLPGGGLALLLDDALLIHARSGLSRQRIEAEALGLASLAAPLVPSADGSLLLRGRMPDETLWHLLRCRIGAEAAGCVTVMPIPAPPAPLALRESYLGDALFLQLDDGRLLRSSARGDIQGEADTLPPLAPAPMLYREGLLFIPSPDAPLLGVYRPDPGEFGEQIDALFLLTPGDTPPAQRVVDVAAAGEDRYALLEAEVGGRQLYRFDASWGSARRVDVAMKTGADIYLATWRDRLLLTSPTQRVQTRVAPGGRIEAPFESPMLAAEHEAWEQSVKDHRLILRAGLIAPLLLASALLLFTALEAATAHALRSCPPGRTALLDPMPARIRWLPTAEDQTRNAGRLGLVLLGTCLLATAGAGLAGAGGRTACLLPAVLAAIQFRVLLLRGCGGHVGFRGRDAIVVDHDGCYFYGSDSQLRQGPGFVFAGAVALPDALPGLGAFDQRILPPAPRQIDAVTAIGLLWNFGHPWLRAAVLFLLGLLLSLGAWLLTA